MPSALLRRVLPYPIRLAVARARAIPPLLLDSWSFARERLGEDRAGEHPFVLCSHRSPLRRPGLPIDEDLQRGKERNVALAGARLDGLLVPPGKICSFAFTVGPPLRLRGFRPGLELHDGSSSRGVGGGLCQVSNLLFLLALTGGMKIVERHRHGLDLFPDSGRTVPFGCGATVAWPYADLRFENPLDEPVLLRVRIVGGELVGELRAARDPGFRVALVETESRFSLEAEGWIRENRVRRQIRGRAGDLILDEEVAHNRARVLYDPEGRPCSAPR